MVTTKTRRTIEALRRLHGPLIPNYPGSPHENEEVDDAEVILHELGHLIQNPKRFPIRPANVEESSAGIGIYLERRTPWKSDLHEMRAIAIELVAARKLGIRLYGYRIIENSLRNSKLFHRFHLNDYEKDRYARFITRIKKHSSTHRYADAIVALVDRERKVKT